MGAIAAAEHSCDAHVTAYCILHTVYWPCLYYFPRLTESSDGKTRRTSEVGAMEYRTNEFEHVLTNNGLSMNVSTSNQGYGSKCVTILRGGVWQRRQSNRILFISLKRWWCSFFCHTLDEKEGDCSPSSSLTFHFLKIRTRTEWLVWLTDAVSFGC
jgi:hypothetical protein